MMSSRPEKMSDFFNKRADSYDTHMKTNINNFEELYHKIAEPIPETEEEIKILDLGCGTGLELEYIFNKAPNAYITGIDISKKMLKRLKEKHKAKTNQIYIIEGSYLKVDFGKEEYDYAISVMTLHHYLHDVKTKLYIKINESLKEGGKYIEGDYVVSPGKRKRTITKTQTNK